MSNFVFLCPCHKPGHRAYLYHLCIQLLNSLSIQHAYCFSHPLCYLSIFYCPGLQKSFLPFFKYFFFAISFLIFLLSLPSNFMAYTANMAHNSKTTYCGIVQTQWTFRSCIVAAALLLLCCIWLQRKIAYDICNQGIPQGSILDPICFVQILSHFPTVVDSMNGLALFMDHGFTTLPLLLLSIYFWVTGIYQIPKASIEINFK